MKRVINTLFCTGLVLVLYSGGIYAQESSVSYSHLFSVTQGLQSPVRIAIDNQNIIYVTDAYQKCIVKFNNSGEFLGKIEPGGQPISIALNNENQIFIGDGKTGAILKLDGNGTATEFYTETVFPSSMVFSPDNLLYVADSKLKQVVVLDMTGNVVRTIGDGTLILPTGIAYDHINDMIYVSEHGGIGPGFKPVVKIWTFDLYGDLVRSTGSYGNGDGQFYRIQGLAVGRCGKMYATDPFQGTVSVFDEAGFITVFGEYGEKSGQLNAPLDIVAGSRGDIWITSMNNGSLEVFNINETNPSSNISSADTSICPGETTDITIDFTGTAPWTFTYTIDGLNPATISDATDNPYTLKVTEAGIYEVTALSDANYTATCFTGSVGISFNPLPVPEFIYTENLLEVNFLNHSTNADSYFWDFGDNETSEETDPVHLYNKPGEYNVALTASNEICGESTIIKTFSILGTSTESIEHENFIKIYPNPSNGKISVEFNNPFQSDLRMEITNIKGQKIYLKVFETQKTIEQIDLSRFPKGIYIIKFISEDLIRTDKIIINE